MPEPDAAPTPPTPADPLLTVEGLTVRFPARGAGLGRKAWIQAVSDASFTVGRGETLGLVGESGCGKTTTGRAILRLTTPSAGRILFDGTDVRAANGAALRRLRRRVQVVFQDPYASLNPRQRVGSIIADGLRVHGLASSRADRDARVVALLEEVGLSGDVVSRFPHEFSGGQRQRIGIARALAVQPDFLVLDEPVSALDVSVQAQILNLLQGLRESHGLSYLFVAHDLHVVEHISDRIAVMYLGSIVESAPRAELVARAMHPYTRALWSANPSPEPGRSRAGRIVLSGSPPSPADRPTGCPFHPRCPALQASGSDELTRRCTETAPAPQSTEAGHTVRCHLYADPANPDATAVVPQRDRYPAAFAAIEPA